MATPAGTIEQVADAVRGADRIVALTGAGISTASGIPDFRGPNGVWTKDPQAEKLSSLSHYLNDPAIRRRAWQGRLTHPAWTAVPNEAHRALVDMEKKGKLHVLVTQNIDGLHQRAGSSNDIVVEIHGSIREVVCMSCDERAPMERALERVRAGEADPPCRSCGGILKSATISFGQNLVEADIVRSHRSAETCDVFLAIGTSLTVYPVAYLPRIAVESGARLAIFNAEPTPYDQVASWVVREPLDRSLPALAGLL